MSSLKAQGLIQALILPAILVGILLPLAGTWQYWQAWLYCGVFLLAVQLITYDLAVHDPALLERRMKISTTREPERAQRIIQTMAGLSFIATYIVSGLDYRFHGAIVPNWLSLLADAAVCGSFWFIYRVFRANTYASSLVEVENEQRVIDTGPYGVVRHPMYTGAIVMLLATPLALGTVWSLLCVVVLIVAVILRLLHEEQVLTGSLPGYAAYCQTVRYRLIPGLW